MLIRTAALAALFVVAASPCSLTTPSTSETTMPVTYSTGAKNARMTAVRDLCADGTLDMLTSNDTVLLSLSLSTAGGSITRQASVLL